jgi:hypothetical protein
MFFNLSKTFPLFPSFLFPEIWWPKEEKKQSEKKGGEVKKPNRTFLATIHYFSSTSVWQQSH